ncbi:MAG: T9SS type A sorting domain-containing protein [Bacteroidales bacterium]|nr:T9SS type A sorting domain-containing protein [Bacteroidales bacterium]
MATHGILHQPAVWQVLVLLRGDHFGRFKGLINFVAGKKRYKLTYIETNINHNLYNRLTDKFYFYKKITYKMQQKRFKLSAVLFLGLWLTALQAQESVNATGGDATGSGGSVSFTVAQLTYQTHTGTNGSVAEGAQQAYEISVVTAIEEAKGINLSMAAYPNPTKNYLTLSIEEFDISNLSYQLYDTQGKLLQSEAINGNRTSINMSNYVSANYFIKVIAKNQAIKEFKIIKQ